MTIKIIIIVIAVLILLGGLISYLRGKTLEDIREDVYQKFLEAENNPHLGGLGKQKMKWVLQQARALLPGWTHLIITDEFLEKVVQKWFDAIKDLLDDGRVNNSEVE